MYYTQFLMAYDADLTGRVIQAVASEVQAGHTDVQPERWAADMRHQWAASPGWDAAWESALAAQNPAPGRDEAVITDGQILASCQQLLGIVSEVPSEASTATQIQAWLLMRGVQFSAAAMQRMDRQELLDLVRDLVD